MDYFTISINPGGGVLIKVLKYLRGVKSDPKANPSATLEKKGNGTGRTYEQDRSR